MEIIFKMKVCSFSFHFIVVDGVIYFVLNVEIVSSIYVIVLYNDQYDEYLFLE